MGETTVGGTTVTPAGAGSIGDVDLPTRMLVFGTAQLDGSIPAAEVFAAAEACQRSTEQVRSCLRRLVAEGLFTRDGVGQRAVYVPTDAGLRALVDFGGRAFQAHVQDTAAAPAWDGEWHLAAFAIPEARRTARDALRDQLGHLGGAAIHNGLYVSPNPWDKDVTGTAAHLGVAEHVTLARTEHLSVGGVSEPRDLAARLWPVDDVAARYRTFVDRWAPARDHLTTMQEHRVLLPDSAFLPAALAMALAYRSCLDADPLLPAELLPRPWPGRAARELLVATRRLALDLRAGTGRPALFATFDDLLDTLPRRGRAGDPGDSPGPGPDSPLDKPNAGRDSLLDHAGPGPDSPIDKPNAGRNSPLDHPGPGPEPHVEPNAGHEPRPDLASPGRNSPLGHATADRHSPLDLASPGRNSPLDHASPGHQSDIEHNAGRGSRDEPHPRGASSDEHTPSPDAGVRRSPGGPT